MVLYFMNTQKLQNTAMKVIGGFKPTKLESDEFRNPELSICERFKPVTKFGQVLWFYRLPNLEAGDFGVEIDGARVIAVIE